MSEAAASPAAKKKKASGGLKKKTEDTPKKDGSGKLKKDGSSGKLKKEGSARKLKKTDDTPKKGSSKSMLPRRPSNSSKPKIPASESSGAISSDSDSMEAAAELAARMTNSSDAASTRQKLSGRQSLGFSNRLGRRMSSAHITAEAAAANVGSAGDGDETMQSPASMELPRMPDRASTSSGELRRGRAATARAGISTSAGDIYQALHSPANSPLGRRAADRSPLDGLGGLQFGRRQSSASAATPDVEQMVGTMIMHDGIMLMVSGSTVLVRAGRLERLVEQLLHPRAAATRREFLDDFFKVLRSFTTPAEVFLLLKRAAAEGISFAGDAISESDSDSDEDDDHENGVVAPGTTSAISREELYSRPQVAQRVCAIIDEWSRRAPCDFFGAESEVGDNVLAWTEEVRNDVPGAAELEASLENRRAAFEWPAFPSLDVQPPMRRGKIPGTFVGVDPQYFAEQLTLVEKRMFAAIEPRELQLMAWAGKRKNDVAPSVIGIARWSNRVNMFLQHQVLSATSDEARATLLSLLVRVGVALHKLHNYAGLQEFIGFMQSSAINRLKKLHATLEADDATAVEHLTEVMQPSGAFAAYRRELATSVASGSAVVPYIGVMLTDLTALCEGNQDILPKWPGYINFRLKFRTIAAALRELARQQAQVHTSITPDLAFQAWIIHSVMSAPNDEEAFYERSLVIEPRSN